MEAGFQTGLMFLALPPCLTGRKEKKDFHNHQTATQLQRRKKKDVGARVCVQNTENESGGRGEGGGVASLTATHKPHFI